MTVILALLLLLSTLVNVASYVRLTRISDGVQRTTEEL